MQFKHVTLDFDGPVAILKLDHPEVMNAVSIDMLGGLGEALDEIGDEVRCLVVTGAGRAFCTGANLQGRNNAKPGKSNAGAALETAFHPFLRRLRNLHCPIVTAVNGPAAGAGMSFALMGDMILCARSSYFLQAFRRIGLVPDCGSTWLLPRLIGKARSVELSLMGERLPAEKALEWGLVNRVYDDAALMEETMKLAHELANGPTIALSLIRKLYWESPDNSYEDQLNLEAQSQRMAGAAGDFKEGVSAIARPPGNIGAILRGAPRDYIALERSAGLNVEAALMQRAYEAGVPSPQVLHVLQPQEELGTGFIMKRVDGETIPRKILRDGQFAQARPKLPGQLGHVLAGIHGLALPQLPELRGMTAAKEMTELERDYRGLDWPPPVVALAL